MKTLIYFAMIMITYFWLLSSLKSKDTDENWRIKK
jgi:hypothetical protein